jgi:hypothetical protein
MKRFLLFVLLVMTASGCANATLTTTVAPTPGYATPITLATRTPFPLNDPALLDLKRLLVEAIQTQDREKLQNTASFVKWVGAIYREGGTPPIDPPRGLTLTQNFVKENKVTMDLARTTYEPVWNIPAGDTAVLALVQPPTGDPFYAHFYIQREPSAWRFTGIMTRIPYYDTPSMAQLRADPAKYDGKEFMYVGKYASKASPPGGAGNAPENAAFLIDTFSGPLWVVMSGEKYVLPLPADADARAGEVVRVFGTVKQNNGAPYLVADSFEFVKPNSWAQAQGVVESVNSATGRVTLKAGGEGATVLQLTPTTFIPAPDGSRDNANAVRAGQTVHATGVPQEDGTLIVEELFIDR